MFFWGEMVRVNCTSNWLDPWTLVFGKQTRKEVCSGVNSNQGLALPLTDGTTPPVPKTALVEAWYPCQIGIRGDKRQPNPIFGGFVLF